MKRKLVNKNNKKNENATIGKQKVTHREITDSSKNNKESLSNTNVIPVSNNFTSQASKADDEAECAKIISLKHSVSFSKHLKNIERGIYDDPVSYHNKILYFKKMILILNF